MKLAQLIRAGMWILFLHRCLLADAKAEPLQDWTLDNGVLTVKLDLTHGGAIGYISKSGSPRNLVNSADEGRYIQQSYYAGQAMNRRAEGQSPAWSPWSWNPIQGGDAHRNRAKVLQFQPSRNSFYVKCIPLLWDMNNQPAEAEMEQWTTLKANVIHVRNRLTCHRTAALYGDELAKDQELPAVYPISALNNLYTYLGPSPFANAAPTNLPVINLASGFWGAYTNVSEHWMAFVDDHQWGMGIYNAQCTRFLAGRSGAAGKETRDSSTSYIAPIKKAVLRKNSVYEYQYEIIIGTLDEIRKQINTHANAR